MLLLPEAAPLAALLLVVLLMLTLRLRSCSLKAAPITGTTLGSIALVFYVRNMQRDGINDKATFYTDTMSSSHLRGRRSIVPCANILGGGSSINFQMYTRASASDWDDFKSEGWAANDLLPLMKRLENYQKPVNNDTHGYDGPIAISNGGQITPVAQDFLRASHAIGIPYSDDIQDLQTSHGAEIWAKYINRHTGRRSDAATAYVHSVMDTQDNLYLRCNARVSRVIFDGNNKAVGVAYVPSRNPGRPELWNSRHSPDSRALRRCNAEMLRGLDIKVVSDLPGVGEEYQDHYTTLSVFRVSNETVTTDDFLRGVKEVQQEIFQEWETSPEKARLSSNSIDAGFKIRPTEAELKEMGPEFNELWNRYFKDKPDKPVIFGSIVAGAYADHTLLPPGKYITMFQYLEYPASRGKIHIKSQNPMSSPSLTVAS
ncbi:Alcohol oxidase 1 [Grifola frondosa]|uniref:Alcohol oxidase 1 n=1 Tax=Grifola frondosa TaxID=5627 RepID=A0A1C7LKZ7_GRIFR|nr:Alcohol oxidase 1 [Grifola frondosa]